MRDKESDSTYIVHLVRDVLEPVLSSLHACNHVSKFGTNDGLSIERLSEYYALVCPLETLFDYLALCTQTRADDHPSLMIEVAENDVHAFAHLS